LLNNGSVAIFCSVEKHKATFLKHLKFQILSTIEKVQNSFSYHASKVPLFSLFWWAYLFFFTHKGNNYLVNAHPMLEAFSFKHVPLAPINNQIIKGHYRRHKTCALKY